MMFHWLPFRGKCVWFKLRPAVRTGGQWGPNVSGRPEQKQSTRRPLRTHPAWSHPPIRMILGSPALHGPIRMILGSSAPLQPIRMILGSPALPGPFKNDSGFSCTSSTNQNDSSLFCCPWSNQSHSSLFCSSCLLPSTVSSSLVLLLHLFYIYFWTKVKLLFFQPHSVNKVSWLPRARQRCFSILVLLPGVCVQQITDSDLCCLIPHEASPGWAMLHGDKPECIVWAVVLLVH